MSKNVEGEGSNSGESLHGKPELLCIEFPGILRNGLVDNAIEALGGWDAIQRVMETGEGKFNLRLREGVGGEVPSNPVQVVSNILCDDEGHAVGTVSQTVRFSALADFTYIDREGRDAEALSERILDPSKDDIALVRPSKLARYDRPRYEPAFRGLFRTANDSQFRQGFAFCRYEDEEVPSAGFASHEAPELLVNKLHELFIQRPMWTRARLTHELGDLSVRDLIPGLRFLSYRFEGSGPFKYVWIRLGYDPRKDAESRKFQSIQMRFDPHSQIAGVWTDKFLRPNRLIAKGEESVARRGRAFFQLCDVPLPEVQRVLANAKFSDTFSANKWGFFDADAFEEIYQTLKRELLTVVGDEAEAMRPQRRRRPMMENLRALARQSEQTGEGEPNELAVELRRRSAAANGDEKDDNEEIEELEGLEAPPNTSTLVNAASLVESDERQEDTIVPFEVLPDDDSDESAQ